MELPDHAMKQPAVADEKPPKKTEDEKDREREERQYREISQARDSYWIEDFGNDEVLKFPTTGTTWNPGKIFSERQMRDCRIPEESALCVATQVEGPNPGLKAMLRIRQQIPDDVLDPSDMDPSDDHTWREPFEIGDYADMELKHLLRLTEAGCSCTPGVIDHRLEAQIKTDHVPGGFKFYLLMEKVPGRNLVNFGELEISERDQVRIAFAMAIYKHRANAWVFPFFASEFYNFGFTHEDCHRRNLMWDRKNRKVYIIDLESATPSEPAEPSLVAEFYLWGLAGVSMDARTREADPMVPGWNAFRDRPYPDEQELIGMAAAAAGKLARAKRYPKN